MFGRIAFMFSALSLLSAGLCLGSSLPIICFVDYLVSTESAQLFESPRDRICPVRVVFSNGFMSTSRTYSCKVPAGELGCVVTVDPTASWVPENLPPQSVYTSLLYSSTEEDAGCVYDEGYPSAFVDDFFGITQIVVQHRFDCTSRP